jgi:hypothetical protein
MKVDFAAKAKLPECLDAALTRLSTALDLLEAANGRRAKAEAAHANFEEELAVMQDDRARLAVELDGALARSKALELASEEAARRLNHACVEIKAVLAGAAARED